MDRIRKAIGRDADADRPTAASDDADLATPDGPAEAEVEGPAPNLFVGEGMAPPAVLEGAEADDAAGTSLAGSQPDGGPAVAQEPSWGWYDEFAIKGNNSSGDAEDPRDGPAAQLAAEVPTPEYPNLTFYIPRTDDMIEEELLSEAPGGDEGGALGIDPTSVWLKSGITTGKPDEAAGPQDGPEPAMAATSTPAPGWSEITLKEGHPPILEPGAEEAPDLAPATGTDVSAWSFQNAYPIKWEGPGFDQPDPPSEAGAEPADTAPEAEKLEAYDYPGDYAQPFGGVDESATGDGRPDLIVGTGAAGAAGGEGGGIFNSGAMTVDESTLDQSGTTVPNDETLTVDGATTESGVPGPGLHRSSDGGEPRADDTYDDTDDDEPVALADLRTEGSRPLSETAPPPEEATDLAEAEEPADLDDLDA